MGSCHTDAPARNSYRRTRTHLLQGGVNVGPASVSRLHLPGAMTSETSTQTYRVRIPETVQPAVDALGEDARTELLSALFSRAMQQVDALEREHLELAALTAELERDPERALLTLVSVSAPSGPAAALTPTLPLTAAQAPAQAPSAPLSAWEQAGFI